jgi:hypothetical protein
LISDQGIFPLCEYKRAGRARRFLVVVAFCQRHDIYTHTCVYTDASRHLFKEEEEEEKNGYTRIYYYVAYLKGKSETRGGAAMKSRLGLAV